jgi:transposase-like protein
VEIYSCLNAKNNNTTRRRFTAAYITKVCLESLNERETIEGLAKKHDIHPNQTNSWKREFNQKSESVFDMDSDCGRESKEKLFESLYSRIGELSVANHFF